jgi:ethanolamine utilization protein EutA
VTDAGRSVAPPDTVVLLSAGIDIGSATTQMIVSRLTMKRMGRAHSSRYVVAAREAVFQSEVIFTPFLDGLTIDSAKLTNVIKGWLEVAASYGAIDSGVVLLTGEAVRQHNAEAIASRMSHLAGDFVCAAAGDMYEARMAAMGSGAVRRSLEIGRVLNIDIGGGTTKLSVVETGEIIESSVVRIGSRGIVTDVDGTVIQMDVSGHLACDALDLPVAVGTHVSAETLRAVADWMIARVDEHIFGIPTPDPAPTLRLMPPLNAATGIDGVVFSSGVAEYIHKRTDERFDDLGIWLAEAVDWHVNHGRWTWKPLPISSPLRATAVGISQYTVEVSGDTIFIGRSVDLPIRNRLVVVVDLTGVDGARFPESMARAAEGTGIDSVDGGVAWKLIHHTGRGYTQVAEFSMALGSALVELDGGSSVVLLSEDLAMTVGKLIADELDIKEAIVILDGISANAAFLDVGTFREDSSTVPIVLKSLSFNPL